MIQWNQPNNAELCKIQALSVKELVQPQHDDGATLVINVTCNPYCYAGPVGCSPVATSLQ